MSSAKKCWRPWAQWLALLGVSVGLHGVGVMLPTPKAPSPPESPQPELPDPIAVVPLPVQENSEPSPPPEPTIAQPIPQAVQVPEESIIAPELIEPEPIEPAPVEPAPAEPEFIEPELTELELIAPEPEPIEPAPVDPVPQVFDATNTDPADTSGYIDFSTTLQSLDGSIVPHNIRGATYDLNYLGDLCFTGQSQLNSSLAVVLDKSPMLTTGKILTSTGYGEINQAIERWFAQLSAGQNSDTEDLASATGAGLYEWIYQQEGEWFLNDETYEAYFLNITVTLINNPCAQDQA